MSNNILPQNCPEIVEKMKSNSVFLSFNQLNSQPQLTNQENFTRSQSTFLSITSQLEAIGDEGNPNYQNQQNQTSSSTNNSTNQTENK